MDLPDNSKKAPDPEWQRLWFSTAHSDIQWAKAQGWQALQWTVVLLAAVVTAAKTFSTLPLCIYLACVLLITAVSIFWLCDLHFFAKKARDAADTLTKDLSGKDEILKARTFDRDHRLYLGTRIIIVVAAAGVVVAELLKVFDNT